MHKTIQKDFDPRPDWSVVGTLLFKARGLTIGKRYSPVPKRVGKSCLVNRASDLGIGL